MKSLRALLAIMFLLPLLGAAPAGAVVTLEVAVQGLAGEQLQNVLNVLSIEKRKDHPLLTPGLILRLHARAPDEIRRALEPFGYYKPVIETDITQEEELWSAVYRVDPGPPVSVSAADLEIKGPGAEDPVLATALEQFPLREGEILVHRAYEDGKRSLLSAARRQGYLDADFVESSVQVSTEKNTAEIMLHLDSGPRYKFGGVTFHQDFLDEEYLAGFVTIREGEEYTLDALLDLQQALSDTRQFRRAEVIAPREKAVELTVPVEVTLTPGPAQRYSIGVGYGTDTGARGKLGWEHRRINRRVHRVRTDLLLSEVEQSLAVRYVVPLARPQTDHLDYTAAWFRENVEDIDSETLMVGISRTRLRGRVQETVFLNLLEEDFTIGSDSEVTALLIPGVSWSRLVTDDPIRTGRGYRATLEVKGASRDLVSDVSFAQARFHIKGILGLGAWGRLITRAELGGTHVDRFSELPASQRFFAGGDQSVRGYDYKSLGPADETGEIVGGENILVGSVEFEVYLSEKWSAAAFIDTGNAMDDFSGSLEQGVGVGVRWRTLVGPIRLDLANAVSEDSRPWRVHLNIGPDL
ncbi:MAG: outer membrane protein assembly factor [bacterium]|nr:MAG: outer membrane protein assembly factor [bacterium]